MAKRATVIGVAVIAVIVLVVMTAGLTVVIMRPSAPPPSLKHLPAEPLPSFSSYCERLLPNLQKRYSAAGAFDHGTLIERVITVSPVYSIDVRKTDSLVSPLVGIARFQKRGRGPRGTAYGPDILELTFGLQDGRWVMTSAIEEQQSDGVHPPKRFDLMKVEEARIEARIVSQTIAETDPAQ
jgi:hypothetical protein